MTPSMLASVRALAEAGTPDLLAERDVFEEDGTIEIVVHNVGTTAFFTSPTNHKRPYGWDAVDDCQPMRDGRLFAAARSTILALLAHIEAVETERDELRAKLAEAEATLARVHTACAAVDARMKNLHKYAATGAEDAIADVRAALADRGSDAR